MYGFLSEFCILFFSTVLSVFFFTTNTTFTISFLLLALLNYSCFSLSIRRNITDFRTFYLSIAFKCSKCPLNIEWVSEVTQSCPTLWDPIDCSLPGSSVHGIFQARVLEWVAISFSRGSSWSRDRTQVSRIGGRCFTDWATREALHTCFSQILIWCIITFIQMKIFVISIETHSLTNERFSCL